MERFRRAGYTGGEVGEFVADVVPSLFTDDFIRVVATDLDLPAAPGLAA